MPCTPLWAIFKVATPTTLPVSSISGGPLIDETGKVVGVATLKIAQSGVQGIGFGVPISKALEMLNIGFDQ